MREIIKKYYRVLPFKKQFFSFIKLFGVPKFYHHLYFRGAFRVKIDAAHSFQFTHFESHFENVLFWFGLQGYDEGHTLKIWSEYSKNANLVLDIGANTGIFSLISQCMNPQASVYAFEPLDRICQSLQKNIAINHYPISVHPVALSNQNGAVTFYDMPYENFQQGSLNPDILQGAVEVNVQAMTLADWLEQNQIKDAIDLMKIDVETHEAEVLEGLGKYLGSYKPIIFLEVLNPDVGRKVHTILTAAGYQYFYNIDEKGSVSSKQPREVAQHRNFICACTDQKAILEKVGDGWRAN